MTKAVALLALCAFATNSMASEEMDFVEVSKKEVVVDVPFPAPFGTTSIRIFRDDTRQARFEIESEGISNSIVRHPRIDIESISFPDFGFRYETSEKNGCVKSILIFVEFGEPKTLPAGDGIVGRDVYSIEVFRDGSAKETYHRIDAIPSVDKLQSEKGTPMMQ